MPCSPKMRERQDGRPGSGCRASCLHRVNVLAYRDERSRQEAAMEHETRLHPGDVALYLQTVTMINFRAWLLGNSRSQVEGFDRWAHLA